MTGPQECLQLIRLDARFPCILLRRALLVSFLVGNHFHGLDSAVAYVQQRYLC